MIKLITFLATAIFSLNATLIYASTDNVPVIDLNLHYYHGAVTITSTGYRTGYVPAKQPATSDDYYIVLLDTKSQELYKSNFAFPTQVYDSTAAGTTFTDVSKMITIPYGKNSSKVQIKDKTQKVLAEEGVSNITPARLPIKAKKNNWLAKGLGIAGVLILLIGAVFLINKVKNRKTDLTEQI